MNIPNTTITETERGYNIATIEGYVLHNSTRDWKDENLETGEKTFYRGYSKSPSGVGLNYDFDNTTEIDGYTAYGTNEIFARPIKEVSEKQIF